MWKLRKSDSYIVDQSTVPLGSSAWQFVGCATKAQMTIKGLSSGTRYWFRVAAVNAAGQGPWSQPVSVVAS